MWVCKLNVSILKQKSCWRRIYSYEIHDEVIHSRLMPRIIHFSATVTKVSEVLRSMGKIVIGVMKAKMNALKKLNVLFIFHFCLSKYSFSLNQFWIQLVFWSQSTFYFVHFCLGKYGYCLIYFENTSHFEEN